MGPSGRKRPPRAAGLECFPVVMSLSSSAAAGSGGGEAERSPAAWVPAAPSARRGTELDTVPGRAASGRVRGVGRGTGTAVSASGRGGTTLTRTGEGVSLSVSLVVPGAGTPAVGSRGGGGRAGSGAGGEVAGTLMARRAAPAGV